MQLQSDFLDVRAFHLKFGLPTGDDGPLRILEPDAYEFRVGFLKEEINEFVEANSKRDLVKAVDALIDFVYVAYGTALFMRAGPFVVSGEPWPKFDEVAARARNLGFDVACPMRPELTVFADLVTFRIESELDLFGLTHRHGGVIAVQFGLDHLRNMACNAYFAAFLMSVPWSRCWRHVQMANMAKVRAAADGSDSKRRSPWDVVKPAGWEKPDQYIARELVMAGAHIPDVLSIR